MNNLADHAVGIDDGLPLVDAKIGSGIDRNQTPERTHIHPKDAGGDHPARHATHGIEQQAQASIFILEGKYAMTPRWLSTTLTIAISVMIALVLTIIPLPEWGEALRPAWVALVVFYWVLALPERFNIGWAWLTGLLLDALTGSLLGAHALVLMVRRICP